jgi:hypothetical protein
MKEALCRTIRSHSIPVKFRISEEIHEIPYWTLLTNKNKGPSGKYYAG